MSAQTRGCLGMAAIIAIAAVPAPVWAEASGAIDFHGAIAASQYVIQTGASAGQPATGVAAVAGGLGTVTVKFGAPHADVPGATVAFYANDSRHSTVGPEARNDITTRFADPSGQLLAWSAGGSYHLPAAGGVLSISSRHVDETAAQTPVTILVSYD